MGTALPSVITAVYDRYTVTVNEMKQLLRMDDDCAVDAFMRLSINAAKKAADKYMSNPFWELADATFDDLVNWRGNQVVSDLETGAGGISPGDDIIFSDSSRTSHPRLDHSIPDIWSLPRVELDIPDDVIMGVVKYVELMMNAPPEGVSEEKIGDWSVKYLNFVSNTNRAAFIHSTYWDGYVLTFGF